MRNLIIANRRFLVVVVHLVLWSVSLAGAFLLRFDFHVAPLFWSKFPLWLLTLLVVRTVVNWNFGVFHGLWRYSGTRDLINMLKASTVSGVLFIAAVTFFGPRMFPRSIFIIDWLASFMIVGGLRFGIRTLREVAVQVAVGPEGRRKILVVGAGDAGEMLVREMSRAQNVNRYQPVGFVDDNLAKVGERIHGVPVLGSLALIPELVARYEVAEIILAIPSMTGRELRKVVDACQSTGAVIRTLPSVDRLIDGKITINQLSNVNIEDLLGREPVVLDTAAISAFINGRVVLVTGAGGSIGSELCRQIGRFAPSKLILVEQAENALFHVHRALLAAYPSLTIVPCIADICDTRRIAAIFAAERPKVVFHAAAHKHVPMMEWNPAEAVKNNVFGTKKVADLAHEHNVEKFVMVSTDKAVNPSSVMGVSKRTAEIYVQALSQRSKTAFVTVRFGNVLGSDGSVVPIFKEQIAKGGPVTVTDPEMKRYFMTIPEACQLVLQAGTMGGGGDILLLDMGEPVKIVDLARDLIKLSGLVPEDIEIVFTGVRPGEKLFEELAVDGENVDKTTHPKIFIGKFLPHAWADVETALRALHAASHEADGDRIRECFSAFVPEYRPLVQPNKRPSMVERAEVEPPAAVRAVLN